MLNADYYAKLDLRHVYEKVVNKQRLSIEDGERLYNCPDVHAVGALAHHVRVTRHGGKAYYVVNRHINYTNVCVNDCLFCAFNRKKGQEGGFELSIPDVLERLGDHTAANAREIHIVGGCHPDLRLAFFIDLLTQIRANFPKMDIKAFTAVEIAHFAALESISTREVLTELKKAGLVMMPGGGAEIFAPEVRKRICPNKISGKEWLRVAGEAHELGIRTNATMLYGHLESRKDRLEHLHELRTLQDKVGEENGFVCFIPLPFQTANSKLEIPNERKGVHTGLEDLKTMAISRLMLDNIPHIKAYWIMLTVKLAQAALFHGADDLDGTVVEEKIGHMAGAASEKALTRTELEMMIHNCGFQPVERDCLFNEIKA